MVKGKIHFRAIFQVLFCSCACMYDVVWCCMSFFWRLRKPKVLLFFCKQETWIGLNVGYMTRIGHILKIYRLLTVVSCQLCQARKFDHQLQKHIKNQRHPKTGILLWKSSIFHDLQDFQRAFWCWRHQSACWPARFCCTVTAGSRHLDETVFSTAWTRWSETSQDMVQKHEKRSASSWARGAQRFEQMTSMPSVCDLFFFFFL